MSDGVEIKTLREPQLLPTKTFVYKISFPQESPTGTNHVILLVKGKKGKYLSIYQHFSTVIIGIFSTTITSIEVVLQLCQQPLSMEITVNIGFFFLFEIRNA